MREAKKLMIEKYQIRRGSSPLERFLPVPRGLLQRKCACGGSTSTGGKCDECRNKELQRKPAGAAGPATAPPIVHEVLSSHGQPLDAQTRSFFEPRFGYDFSKVRVHADEKASQSAQAVNALAYAVGRHLVFGTGMYAPGLSEGRQLLAHELMHVVQQNGAATGDYAGAPTFAGRLLSLASDSSEQQADRVSKHLMSGSQVAEPAETPVSALSRQEKSSPSTKSLLLEIEGLEARVLGPGVDCDAACEAFRSMSRVVERLCQLTGEEDPRCKKAREKLVRAELRLIQAGCQCRRVSTSRA
jgi:hypothetical protein